jgi:carbamoylphosphate synthase small subunit
MAKKSTRKAYEFSIEGKPASLLEIAENSGDENVWKSFLERHGLQHSMSADHYLKTKLGQYLSAHEIHILSGIKTRTLNKWRKQGVLQAEQLKGRWYYSVRNLISAIKSADIEDIRS